MTNDLVQYTANLIHTEQIKRSVDMGNDVERRSLIFMIWSCAVNQL